MKKKLMRFMGVNELAAFLAGQELENHTDWRKKEQSTDSKGFCFFDLSEPPEERLKYLAGVVDRSFIAVFEVEDGVKLRESSGRYAIPGNGAVYPPPMQNKVEYSIEQYSSRTFKIERFGVTNLVGMCDDGEMKFLVTWLWEDSEMPLDEWAEQATEWISGKAYKRAAKVAPEEWETEEMSGEFSKELTKDLREELIEKPRREGRMITLEADG